MLCAKCKGRLLCGRLKCPLLQKFKFLKSVKIEGYIENPTPPSAFVGRFGYPKVYTGSLVALKDEYDVKYLDSPWIWSGSVEEIIKIRTSMVRVTKRVDVSNPANPDKFLIDVQEATASIESLEIDAKVDKVNKNLVFSDTTQPYGFQCNC